METMTLVKALREFFEAGGDRKISLQEIKELSEDEREYFRVELEKVLGATVTRGSK